MVFSCLPFLQDTTFLFSALHRVMTSVDISVAIERL
jgi:hypothetical protein